MKKILSIALLFVIIFTLSSPALAANVEKTPIPISKFCVNPPVSSDLFSSSTFSTTQAGAITQTKSVYMNGVYVGYIRLHYDLTIQGGRPQFVYETAGITYDFRSLPAGYTYSIQDFYFTGDEITVLVHFMMTGIILNDVYVSFSASGTPD